MAVTLGASFGAAFLIIIVVGLLFWWRHRHNQQIFFDVNGKLMYFIVLVCYFLVIDPDFQSPSGCCRFSCVGVGLLACYLMHFKFYHSLDIFVCVIYFTCCI